MPESLPWKASAIALLLLSAVGSFSCRRGDKATGESAQTSASASVTTQAQAVKAGFISGRITRPDGSPIGVAGTSFSVLIKGVSGPGENVEFRPPVNPDGTFSIHVPSGIYHPAEASMKVPFDNSFYTYVPEATTMVSDTQSDRGIIANFAWKFSGPSPWHRDQPSVESPNDWYGAVCGLQWDSTYPDAQGHNHLLSVPDGSKFVITASPNGKLIDGSDGKPITFNLKWDPMAGIRPSAINDLPPALKGWHITGNVVHADGSSMGLLFKISPTDKYAAAVDASMLAPPPGSMAGGLPAMGVTLFTTEPPQ